jgi:hypothetical protein
LYVNVTEYLPTTEATGIKMVVHEKTSFPFPDTFGYNAPVGYISSFGIKMVSAHTSQHTRWVLAQNVTLVGSVR